MTLAPETTATATALKVEISIGGDAGQWVTVCGTDALLPGRGVAALLPDGRQVALFLDREDRIHAIDNLDPFTGAAVLSRGLTGTVDGRPYVASPLLKQRFDLLDGRCLDEDDVRIEVHQVRAA